MNISGTEYSPLKILGLAFYTTLLNVSDIDTNSFGNLFANSFAHFQVGALNSEKNKELEKRKTRFETNVKLQYENRGD